MRIGYKTLVTSKFNALTWLLERPSDEMETKNTLKPLHFHMQTSTVFRICEKIWKIFLFRRGKGEDHTESLLSYRRFAVVRAISDH